MMSFGPVQPFIEAARRTRDFTMGSRMLLAAVTAAGKALQADYRADLIIPTVGTDSRAWTDAGAANIILALLPNTEAEAATRGAEAAARKELERWLDQAIKVSKLAPPLVDVELGLKQMQSVLEVYAGWADMPKESDFAQARKRAFARMQASKAIRFRTVPPPSKCRPKSPLLPQFESILAVDDGFRLDARIPSSLHLNPRETLDGPSFAKRLYPGHREVFSMKAMAARELYMSHADTEEGLRLRAVCERQGWPFHDRPLFPEEALYPLDPFEFKAENEDQRRVLREIDRARREFLRVHHGGSPPRGYFAVIHADGDHIGAAIDGLKTRNEVAEFSRELTAFSRVANAMIKEHGRLTGDEERDPTVFVGGDDVLGLLPLKTAVYCAEKLAGEFAARMGRFSVQKPPTLSIGVALVHYSARLGDAIDYAKRLESRAKREGRNRIAIGAQVRSGTDLEVVMTWDEKPSQWFEQILNLYDEKVVPRGFSQDVAELASDFKNAGTITSCHQRAEYERLCRKKASRNMQAFLSLAPPSVERADSEGSSYQRLADLLRVCHFVSRPGGDLE